VPATNTGTWRARKARKAATSLRFEAGAPPRPAGLPRATRNAWNALVSELQGRNVLAQTDGQFLLDLIQARADAYRAGGERRPAARARVAEIEAMFSARQPFTEKPKDDAPAPVELTLEEFLADTARQRATFTARLVPGQTILLDDDNQAFTWPDDDPSTRARDYCQRVVQGVLPACDLHKRACARFLRDLEDGAARGFFFDAVAARHIATWFAVFCKRPLFDWQLFTVVNLFGWRLPSGLRRFKECWLWVARQNGKSSLSAGIGLFALLADGEDRQQVYSAATTKDQAEIIFRDAKRIVATNPELAAALKSFRYSLVEEISDSAFQPLASEIASLDGLRPGALLCDEVHEWDNAAGGREQWAKLTSGQVSRQHPLTIAISTAGGAQRGFGWEKYGVVKKILHGVVTAEDIFCCVWELDPEDDYRDESLWIKANPALGSSLTIEALRKQFNETVSDPSSLSGFLRYQCNRWVAFAKTTATFSIAKVDAARGCPHMPKATPRELYSWFLEHNAGVPSFGGYDYGEVNDLAAFVLLYPKVRNEKGEGLPVKVLLAEFWMPEAHVQQRQKEWGVPVEQWIRDGWIRACPGDMNDPRQLRNDILEFTQLRQEPSGFPIFNIRSIGYDPWHSRPFMGVLAEDTSIECAEVKQQPGILTPIAVAFKSAVLSGALWTLGNPVVQWMLSNVILERSGKYDAIVPEKPDKFSKIDAVQAAMCAWQRMENAPEESVYKTRGIVTI